MPDPAGISYFSEEVADQSRRLPIRVSARRRITHARYEFILHHLGISGHQWRGWQGVRSLTEFLDLNPHTTERAFLEDLIEHMEIARQFA